MNTPKRNQTVIATQIGLPSMGRISNYRVTRTTNFLEIAVGTTLTKTDLQRLIDRGINVSIQINK